MKFRTGATIAALAASATMATVAPASAAPGPDVHFLARPVGQSVVLSMDAGRVTVADNHLHLLDRSGTEVATLPLAYLRDGREMPIAAALDGNSVTLTAATDPSAARPADPGTAREIDALAHPNFNAALGNFSMEMMAAATVGSLLGSTTGAAIGCVAGGIVGGLGGGVVSVGVLAIPGALGGCLVTGAALAAMGAVVGTIAVGLPALAAAGAQFWNDNH